MNKRVLGVQFPDNTPPDVMRALGAGGAAPTTESQGSAQDFQQAIAAAQMEDIL